MHPRRSLSLAFVSASFALATATVARAQCTVSWSPAFGTGADNSISALAALGGEQLVAGGRFANVDGTAAARVARFDGANWQPLGTGMNGDVYALAPLQNGELLAGGAFTTAGAATVNCIARWDGSAWQALGAGVDPLQPFGSSVQAIVVLGNGHVVIGGTFSAIGGQTVNNVARWDGSSWNPMGVGINGPVRGLAVAPNGDVFATGSFTQAGGLAAASVARWNGTSWSALGSGLGVFGGSAITAMPNGDIVVGGSFITAGGGGANRIARWNGAGWSALGTGTNAVVASLLALPNGDLIAGGLFTTAGGQPANRIAKWNGVAWSSFGSGVDAGVQELVQRGIGDVIVGGDFTSANGAAVGRVARLVSSCAPQVADLGGGCTGSGGPNVMTAVTLPLLGDTFRAVGTGMPALGFVVSVVGFSTTTLPLDVVLPEALPGCVLRANLDVFGVVNPVAGTVETAIDIPNDLALIGVSLTHQYVPFELDLSLAISAITSSNGLEVTIGSF